jgi:uncharacterized protein (DUF1015 family)
LDNLTAKAPLITPFRGIRYASFDVSSLICPPYDIISASEQEELYKRSSQNVIRLEFTRAEGSQDRYQSAARCWQEWLQTGILQQDAEAFYVLQTEFISQGKPCLRQGFFASLHLESLQNGRVLPHEDTHGAAKADRLALLRATHANFSPIWTIYHNPALAALLAAACSGPPVSSAEASDSGKHSLWRVGEAGIIEKITKMMGDGPIFIADGHHRYETALAFSEEMNKQATASPPQAPHHYVLSFMTEAEDPGLLIFPTHRAVAGIGEGAAEKLRHLLNESCDLTSVPNLDSLISQVYAGEDLLGIYTKDEGYQLIRIRRALQEDSRTKESVPVKLLHHHLLEPAFGEALNIAYHKDAAQACADVDSGGFFAAFFLRPLRSQELIQAAEARERLPGKSTYFWPKIPAGLVLRKLE